MNFLIFFSTTVDKLKNGELSHDCINEDKKKKKGAKYKNSGVIQFNKVKTFFFTIMQSSLENLLEYTAFLYYH